MRNLISEEERYNECVITLNTVEPLCHSLAEAFVKCVSQHLMLLAITL
jgi:hypothetical protein